MLDFLEHANARAPAISLLVIGTTRLEPFERRPSYVAALPNAHRINLAALSQDETTELVTGLLDGATLEPDAQRQVREKAGGNPLYVEELLRLVVAREDPAGLGGLEVALPLSLRALIVDDETRTRLLATLCPPQRARQQRCHPLEADRHRTGDPTRLATLVAPMHHRRRFRGDSPPIAQRNRTPRRAPASWSSAIRPGPPQSARMCLAAAAPHRR
jgi:hypothetical protein